MRRPANHGPRALAEFRARGWTQATTEHWIPIPGGARVRRDLFGAFDYVALEPGRVGIVGVQVTSGSSHANRRTKLLRNGVLRLWLECQNRILVWSYRQTAPGRPWALREEPITIDMLLPTNDPRTFPDSICPLEFT